MGEHKLPIWLTLIGLIGSIGTALLATGLSLRNSGLFWLGCALLGLAVLGIVTLLLGRRAVGATETDVTPTPGLGEAPWAVEGAIQGLPQYPIPVWTTSRDEMTQLSPYNWLLWPDREAPELDLRGAVALPAVNRSMYRHPEVATSIQGEDREEFVLDTLERATLTQWLRGLSESWHCAADASWTVQGNSNPEFTELRLRPMSAALEQPLMARCALLTGWRTVGPDERVLAMRFAIDVMFNLTQLDGDRNPATNTSDHAGPVGVEPARAALSLDELAQYQVQLVSALALGEELGSALMPGGDFATGYVGSWISPNRVPFQRSVNLSGLRRLPDSYGPGTHTSIGNWPLPAGDGFSAIGNFVADGLDALLERAGYRGVQDRFTWLRALEDPEHPQTPSAGSS